MNKTDLIDAIYEEVGLTKKDTSSSPQEKIQLFLSLFKGKKDVYARRY